MIAFDHIHNPPAPVIEITVRNPLNRRLRRSLPALLDTGSDVTAIPEAAHVALQLYPVGRYLIEGVGTTADSIYAYKAVLLINDFVSAPIEVIETPLAFAVIGRDVLKHFNLHLYGREQMFELVTV